MYYMYTHTYIYIYIYIYLYTTDPPRNIIRNRVYVSNLSLSLTYTTLTYAGLGVELHTKENGTFIRRLAQGPGQSAGARQRVCMFVFLPPPPGPLYPPSLSPLPPLTVLSNVSYSAAHYHFPSPNKTRTAIQTKSPYKPAPPYTRLTNKTHQYTHTKQHKACVWETKWWLCLLTRRGMCQLRATQSREQARRMGTARRWINGWISLPRTLPRIAVCVFYDETEKEDGSEKYRASARARPRGREAEREGGRERERASERERECERESKRASEREGERKKREHD